MNQNRFKSPVLWAAVVAQVLSILIAFGVIDVAKQEAINTVTASALQLLVVFGILNSPTSADKF